MSCLHSIKFSGLGLVFMALQAHAQTRVENGDQLRALVGALSYADADLSNVKIAVLDNGFQGFSPDAKLLPSNALLVEGPINAQAPTNHGLGMAQIAWAVSGRTERGPQFYLVNANGFSNFKAAVDYVIANRVDLVLYSQVWSFGGNFDGAGFINAQVDRAVNSGALWINAAGNTHNSVYNGSVSIADATTGTVRLPGPGQTLRFENRLDANPITVTLAWNDFTDNENDKSIKDLDLLLYRNGKLVPTANKVQRGESPSQAHPEYSAYARESFTATLDRGAYTLQVVARSKNFTASDKLRVNIESDRPASVEFLDRSGQGEVMIPADNPNVLTVGDCGDESARGPTRDGRQKPDVVLPDARVSFSDGNQSAGTSNATAIVVGSLAALKGKNPGFNRADLTRWSTALRDRSPSCGGAPHWRLPAPGERY